MKTLSKTTVVAATLLSVVLIFGSGIIFLIREHRAAATTARDIFHAAAGDLAENLALRIKLQDVASLNRIMTHSYVAKASSFVTISDAEGHVLYFLPEGPQPKVLSACADEKGHETVTYDGVTVGGIDYCFRISSTMGRVSMAMVLGSYFLGSALLSVLLIGLIRLNNRQIAGFLDWLDRIELSNPRKLTAPPESLRDENIKTLYQKVASVLQELGRLNAIELESQRAAAMSSLSAQVAHDIRSPLAALDSAMKDLSGLSEDKRSLVRSAVGRIRDIANDLIEKNRDLNNSAKLSITEILRTPRVAAVHLISSHLDSLITEKRLQFRSRMGVEIDSQIHPSSYGTFAMIEPAAFKRALSNLINNSVEAIARDGKVTIDLSSDNGQVVLKVCDDGQGISPDILGRLGQRGESHGKAEGLGLGLHYARTSVESWGGTMDIASDPGKGTIITIRLPRAQAPAWFVSELSLPAHGTVVVLDDDTSIHHVWQGRFSSLRIKEQGVAAFHFSTADQFRAWIGENAVLSKTALYLIDYELLGSLETGLQLVDKLGIAQRSILVTSRSEEPAILDECVRLGVRMIPKNLAGFVPISISSQPRAQDAALGTQPRAVLLDNDPLVHMTWKLAAKTKGVNLLSFHTPKDLFASLDRVPTDTPVYLDSELGNGARGEQFAEALHSRGYRDLYLATGRDPESFAALPFIRRIVGKEPPWHS